MGSKPKRRWWQWVSPPRAQRWVLLLACVLIGATASHAQRLSVPVVDGTGLGRSVRLPEAWRAAPGDDPHWAAPSFHDSDWIPLKAEQALAANFGDVRSIWYRLHVDVPPNRPPVALYVEGLYFNYAVFVNGVQIGQQGSLDPAQGNQLHPPQGFRIPPELIDQSAGHLVIALHISSGPVGFLGFAPFGSAAHLELTGMDEVPLRESFRLAHQWSEPFVIAGLNLLVCLCALVIWWSLREQKEYLPLAIWTLCNVLAVAINFAGQHTGAAPASPLVLAHVSVEAISAVAEMEFVRLLLKRRADALWLSLEAAAFAIFFFEPLLATGRLSLRLAATVVFTRPLITEVFLWLMLLRGALRGNRDAPLLLLPVGLWSIADVYGIVQSIVFSSAKVLWPDLPKLHLFSYTVQFATVADGLGMCSLVLIILRRTIRLTRERADLAAEVAAAEELQLLLMARASRPTPGYRVQTEYRPMQQVGGDFFLVQPCEEDDTLVAIVGDVSGKGLQAAMRVSMILGVLQRSVMGEPDRVLETLNKALLAQGDLGFTTACCVRLEGDGSFCFANAGHLDPYVDGKELPTEGALPLGIDADARYPVQCGRLLPGQRMILLPDGILEARNKQGELFGFQRTAELVCLETAAIADVAQRFGQEDDITVLSLALA